MEVRRASSGQPGRIRELAAALRLYEQGRRGLRRARHSVGSVFLFLLLEILRGVLADVFSFRDLLVFVIGAVGVPVAGGFQVRLTDGFRADGESGYELFKVLALTRRARYDSVLEHDQFEFFATALTVV